jgi:hypothetical protein
MLLGWFLGRVRLCPLLGRDQHDFGRRKRQWVRVAHLHGGFEDGRQE